MAAGTLSPMMQQYLQIRQQYPDCILFFRLGDFYEMFFEDAKLVSRLLELTLTGRDCGGKEKAPMCGVPFHSYETYAARLIRLGYKVAICEQMEDPSKTKGLVRRDVIRVITPGTVSDGPLLDAGRNNFLGAVYFSERAAGLCFLDISTGEMACTQVLIPAPTKNGSHKAELQRSIEMELYRFSPAELLLPENTDESVTEYARERLHTAITKVEPEKASPDAAVPMLLQHFRKESLGELDLFNREEAATAAAMLLQYVNATQKVAAGRIIACNYYSGDRYLALDPMTQRNLELTETMRTGERVGSLLHVLDKTRTAMGKRLMRATVERPLVDLARILRRLDAVSELFENSYLRADLLDVLDQVYDLERLMTKVHCGSCNPRELLLLSQAMGQMPALKALLEQLPQSALLRELNDTVDPLTDLSAYIQAMLVDNPPVVQAEGGIIRPGFDSRVDEYRDLEQNARGYLAEMEAKEREDTGIKNLRITYNRVFGYAIEVTHSNASLVPERYIRKQTLTNSERYITPELKALEERLLSASEQLIAREQALFAEGCHAIAEQIERVQNTARAVAELDVLCSFAEVSQQNNYCRPQLRTDRHLHIIDGRHPVLEQLLGGAPFVSNDIDFDDSEQRVLVITGPNMAGKSTYMRQTALIVLMAQLGCFVPARSAEIGLCDAIFTRVGASDDLSTGQSTFMVEMNEVAHILRNATADSLILLDEIGRGTSTYDGMSIARAVVEFVADPKKIGARTLFATHYHELTELEEQLPGVKNYSIAAIKRADTLTFLRKVVRGGADESYGIEVAKLAGVPDGVIRRAKTILQQLEEKMPTQRQNRKNQPQEMQMLLISEREARLVELLNRINIESLTPIEAMNRLYELIQTAKNL